MDPKRQAPEQKIIDRQVKAFDGFIKMLSAKGFYGNLTIRFEGGVVVKCDSSSSLRVGDIEELLKVGSHAG